MNPAMCVNNEDTFHVTCEKGMEEPVCVSKDWNLWIECDVGEKAVCQ